MRTKPELDALYFKAMDFYEAEDYAAAFPLFLEGAVAGHDAAQNLVALSYCYGYGVEKDIAQALRWHKRAWRTAGAAYVAKNIALTYAEIEQRRPALYWWKKAISGGDGDASLSLAEFLLKERNGKPDKRIRSLLEFVVSEAARDITSEDGVERAQELLNLPDWQ